MQLNGTFDVKLGRSFTDPSTTSFMTMRCDFMPASVDRTQPGSIEVNDGKVVVVSLPNVASAGPGSTVFRGSARAVQKECVLIYNKKTGEMTLERIMHAAQLKKTREEKPAELTASGPTSAVPPHQSQGRSCGATTTVAPTQKPAGSTQLPPPPSDSKKPNSRTLSSSSSSNESDLHESSIDSDASLSEAEEEQAAVESSLSDSSMSCSSEQDVRSKVTHRQHVITTDSQGKVVNTASETFVLSQSLHRTLIEHDLKLSDSDSDTN